jgi:hypothetical protein
MKMLRLEMRYGGKTAHLCLVDDADTVMQQITLPREHMAMLQAAAEGAEGKRAALPDDAEYEKRQRRVLELSR